MTTVDSGHPSEYRRCDDNIGGRSHLRKRVKLILNKIDLGWAASGTDDATLVRAWTILPERRSYRWVASHGNE